MKLLPCEQTSTVGHPRASLGQAGRALLAASVLLLCGVRQVGFWARQLALVQRPFASWAWPAL